MLKLQVTKIMHHRKANTVHFIYNQRLYS